ncbi:MAG: hypothetical protein JNM63_05630, partial [Spirochaetia bacterium]|nr:hypothetical protein [Spirochaetia bacterium]
MKYPFLSFWTGLLLTLSLHSQNLTTEEWKRGDTLCREKKWDEAVAHAKNLISKYPQNSFGFWLLSQAYGNLAQTDPNLWIPAAEAAVKAGDRETDKSANYSHAIWCYYNAKSWSSLTPLARPVLENGRKTTGDNNYALSLLYLVTAFQEQGKSVLARKLLAEAHQIFKDAPQVLF